MGSVFEPPGTQKFDTVSTWPHPLVVSNNQEYLIRDSAKKARYPTGAPHAGRPFGRSADSKGLRPLPPTPEGNLVVELGAEGYRPKF